MHALIIEDHEVIASFVRDFLRELGYRSFDIVTREQEAIAAAAKQCPDLITADDALTDGSGIRAVLEICRQAPIAVVFIAGETEGIAAAIPDAVIVQKPFAEEELRAAVEVALQRARSDSQAVVRSEKSARDYKP